MTLVGCDLHSRKQQVAVLDTSTGEVLEEELAHDGDAVERFYRALPPPVTIGIETTGYTQWFHALMHRLGHTVLVGEAGKIRTMIVRKTKTDRRDARHCSIFSSMTASPLSGFPILTPRARLPSVQRDSIRRHRTSGSRQPCNRPLVPSVGVPKTFRGWNRRVTTAIVFKPSPWPFELTHWTSRPA